jgi:hypothetical protein
MTDPSDDDEPPVPGGAPTPTIADLDGGVARRLTTRCRIAASVLLVLAAGCLLIGVLNDFTTSTALLLLLAAGAVAWGAMLLRRAALWSSVAGSPLPSSRGTDAVVGPPKRLSPGLAGAPVKRRLGAKVVPIHAEVDPQPGGGALVVHARLDGLEFAAGDGVEAWPAAGVAVGPAGLAGPADPGAAAPTLGRSSTKGPAGRWVLYRAADGAVFLATARLSDTW